MLAAFGRNVREFCLQATLTQRQLAASAGVSESTLRRVERGASASISVDTLQRIGYALDRPVAVQLGRGMGEPIDAGHLAMQELVVRLVGNAGYRPRVELPAVRHGTWRSSDVAAMRAADHSLLGIECWNTIGDLGAGFRSSDRKRHDLEELAGRTWCSATIASGIRWVIRATRANRELVGEVPDAHRVAVPGIFVGRGAGANEGRCAAHRRRPRLVRRRSDTDLPVATPRDDRVTGGTLAGTGAASPAPIAPPRPAAHRPMTATGEKTGATSS